MGLFFVGLLEVSVSMSFVLAALLALRPVLRRAYDARWRCAAWLAVAARLAIPWNRALPRAPIAADALSPLVTVWRSATPPQEWESFPGEVRYPASSVAGVIWLAVCVALLVGQLAAYAAFLHGVRRWRKPVENARVRERFGVLRGRVGVAARLYVCPKISGPMTVGLLRPMVLLPEEAELSEELELVLLHELCHIRRRDVLYKLLLALARTVHWFNPLVWAMERAAGGDIEQSCDAAVLRGADRAQREQYAQTVLAAARAQRGTLFQTRFGGGKRVVRLRLDAIFSEASRKRGTAALCAVVLAALLAGAFVGFTGTEKPGSAIDIDRLFHSVRLEEGGRIVFTTPDFPEGTRLYLTVAGRVRMGDGAMSFHAFETETAGGEWEPRRTYTYDAGPGFIEAEFLAGSIAEGAQGDLALRGAHLSSDGAVDFSVDAVATT